MAVKTGEMPTIELRLDKSTGTRLAALARRTRRKPSYWATRAIREFLEEREDYLEAVSRLEDESDEIISMDEMRRRLGLDR